MDILLNEEEEMVKRSAREFLEIECPPNLVRDMETDEKGYPPDLWKKMAELGWLSLALPEQYGGQGAPITHLGLIMEEVGRAVAPVPLHSTMVAALTIARNGTEAQCQELLPRVGNGELILTWAVQERDPRLLPECIKTQAVLEGDQFVITGTKLFVDNFNVAEKCLVVCRTDPASQGPEGISLLLVDTNSPGISYTPFITLAKDKHGKVEFNQVRVPRANLVGELNKGWPVAEWMIDLATALLCAQMAGATRKDMEMAVEYSKGRVAFGQPIGAFQSIQHLCADMLNWVDGAELLTREALWRISQGLPATIEVSQAKAFCNEKCLAVARSSQIIHGGIGFIKEFNLNLWYRRIAAWTMRLGTAFEHRAKIAQALLDRPGRVRLDQPLYELVSS